MDGKENARPGGNRETGAKTDKTRQKYQADACKASHQTPPTLEEATEALYCIPADCSEEEWSNAGMAFASEFPGDLATFDAWSQQAPAKYNAADLKARWRRWTSKGGKTIATLFYFAKAYGYRPSRSTAPPSPEAQAKAEQERARRRAEAQRKAEEAAAEAAHAEQRAAEERRKAPPVPESHGYPARKKLDVALLNAWGCRLFRGNLTVSGLVIDGCLMVPAMDMDGTVKSLQFIHPDTPGKDGKRNLPIAPLKGRFWPLGELSETGPIYLAEGPATAASIHEASQQCTLCTFSGGNLEAVALAVRERYPQAPIILCADDDPTGKTSAILAAHAVGGLITLPNLAGAEGKDFNDLHQAQGLEAVRASLATTYTPEDLARLILADPGTLEPTRRKLSFAEVQTAPAKVGAESRQATASRPEANAVDNDAATVARLARLSAFDYDRIRKDEAERLGVRPETLDKERNRYLAKQAQETQEAQGSKLELYEPEPWPIPVKGSEILTQTYQAIKQHMAIKEEYAIIAALWIIHSHIFDSFSHTPRLVITAPNAECGKSVLLYHLIGNLITSPLSAEDLTPPVFYRVIESHSPSLLIDECDTFFKQDSSLIGGINGGWEPNGGALRCVGDDSEVRRFSTYAPVAMAGIKLHKILPPATLSRSFVITLERAVEGEIAEVYDREKHQQGLLTTGRKIARWCADNRETVRAIRPSLPTNARNRRADKWRPLFSIAELAGEEWQKKVLRAYLSEEQEDTAKLDTALQLLADIREVLKPHEHVIPTAELIEKLCALDESPWLEYNFKERDSDRRKLQDRQISRLLKDYRVTPGTVRTAPGATGTAKGYRRTDLEIAWKRYLPATPLTVTPSQSSNGAAFSEISAVTTSADVTANKTPQPPYGAACDGVTDSKSDTFTTDDERMAF